MSTHMADVITLGHGGTSYTTLQTPQAGSILNHSPIVDDKHPIVSHVQGHRGLLLASTW